MIVKKIEAKVISDSAGVERRVLSRGGKLMGVEFTFQKGDIGAMHSHPHQQVGYVVRGRFERTIDENKTIIEVGDSYYAPPNVQHGVLALEDGVIYDVFTPFREDFLQEV